MKRQAGRLRKQAMSDNSTLPEQPFISHLIELRDRLMRMVLAVLVIFLALFPFGNDIYVFVADPLMKVLPEGTSMIATQVASPFLTPFKLALVAAVFIAMPYLLHQFWGVHRARALSARKTPGAAAAGVQRLPVLPRCGLRLRGGISRWCSPS